MKRKITLFVFAAVIIALGFGFFAPSFHDAVDEAEQGRNEAAITAIHKIKSGVVHD